MTRGRRDQVTGNAADRPIVNAEPNQLSGGIGWPVARPTPRDCRCSPRTSTMATLLVQPDVPTNPDVVA
jgi:hypothetical protein